jgi:hypothetical protein
MFVTVTSCDVAVRYAGTLHANPWVKIHVIIADLMLRKYQFNKSCPAEQHF